jgi:hypothetical protein
MITLPDSPPSELITELPTDATNEEIIAKINEIILNLNYILEPYIVK